MIDDLRDTAFALLSIERRDIPSPAPEVAALLNHMHQLADLMLALHHGYDQNNEISKETLGSIAGFVGTAAVLDAALDAAQKAAADLQAAIAKAQGLTRID